MLLLNCDTRTLFQKTFLLVTVGMFFCFAQPWNIYFGDLHDHTSLSDGSGTPEGAFLQARNGKADFLAVTDHSWYGDAEWKRIGEAAQNYTTSTFCGIRGFEMTAGWGHMNIFNTQWYTDALPIQAIYDTLAKHPEAIAQWNHPDYYMEPGSPFFYYSPVYDSIINLLEIYNGKRGVLYEKEYQFALDKGWHVGPTANSDNHSASWITGYDFRTAILAHTLQRDSLLDAMRNHRTYATMNRNLKIFFAINNSIMGSVIHDSSSLLMRVSVSDPDTIYNAERIARIIVFCNSGRVVAEKMFDAHTVDWEYELNQPRLYQCTYYYVKVINNDGDHAITAPVWIEGKWIEPDKPVQPPPPVKIDRFLFDLQGRQVALVDINGDTRLPRNVSSGIYVQKEQKCQTTQEHKMLFIQNADSHR
ncbi:MAG TPA: CehA/McbA family metallohydrolase [Chitinispirillaceae bacterium]|nr:CehA/McbA family metallohydrolase [Chitinispirillaceae bacterium]